VPALIREEVPLGLSPWDFELAKANQLESEKRKVRWILMGSSLKGLGSRISIPLLAGDLTSPAGRTFCRIYEKGFVCHRCHLL
jgi:hypothetical protein